MLAGMKKLLILAALVGVAAYSPAQVTINGKPSKGTVISTPKQKGTKAVTATPKKHRKKFLGIF